MPWKEASTMSLRKEYVLIANQPGRNIRQLCRQYGISSRTAYKWIARYKQEGEAGLVDRSRRPRRSKRKTTAEMETLVVAERERTGWGGRKIAQVLRNRGYKDVPHPNTITDILRRQGKLDPEVSAKHSGDQRFERALANELWQMDFKGEFELLVGQCHPFTVLDDHSRFCLGLKASDNERRDTVKGYLTGIFRQYGLPNAILSDNGPPWGGFRPEMCFSELALWLIRLGIRPIHGRPGHPQTQGKEERFHRTLQVELLQGHSFSNFDDCQSHFDRWRDRYNLERPHEALGLQVPAQHYHPSPRTFPETLPPVQYDQGEIVRRVQRDFTLSFQGKVFKVSRALRNQLVALRPTDQDGIYDVYFCHIKIDCIDLTMGKP